MVCKWTGLWSSKAELLVNHMDNRQLSNIVKIGVGVFIQSFIHLSLIDSIQK